MVKYSKSVKVGDKIPEDYKGVFELDVYDFLETLNPPKEFKLEEIKPCYFFITSGDAIQKTKFLKDKIWNYAGTARKRLNQMKSPSNKAKEFEKECWKQAGAVTKLLNALEKARGSAVFLETEWHDQTLYCIPKNPRTKK